MWGNPPVLPGRAPNLPGAFAVETGHERPCRLLRCDQPAFRVQASEMLVGIGTDLSGSPVTDPPLCPSSISGSRRKATTLMSIDAAYDPGSMEGLDPSGCTVAALLISTSIRPASPRALPTTSAAAPGSAEIGLYQRRHGLGIEGVRVQHVPRPHTKPTWRPLDSC